ncbi:elongation factor Tu GTP binding domain protein, partial [Vibrio parahaemolyticus V-223/04]
TLLAFTLFLHCTVLVLVTCLSLSKKRTSRQRHVLVPLF